MCVIDSREAAADLFTAEYLYVQNRVTMHSNENCGQGTKKEIEEATARFKLEYNNASASEKKVWEFKARGHMMRWDTIKGEIWAILSMNVNKSYTHIAKDLKWCSKDTIRRWLRRQPTYKTYRQHMRPGLTQKNKEAQKQFAKLVLANWNLPRGKILWIQHDEKWFWGLTPRSNAKVAPFVLYVLCALMANRPPLSSPPLPLYHLRLAQALVSPSKVTVSTTKITWIKRCAFL